MALNPNIILQAGKGVTPINRLDPMREAAFGMQVENNNMRREAMQMKQNALKTAAKEKADKRHAAKVYAELGSVKDAQSYARFYQREVSDDPDAAKAMPSPEQWSPEVNEQIRSVLKSTFLDGSALVADERSARDFQANQEHREWGYGDSDRKFEQAQRNADRSHSLAASRLEWQKNKPASGGVHITGYDADGRPLIQVGGSAPGVSKKEVDEALKSNAKRLAELNAGKAMRQVSIQKANDFLKAFTAKKASSGAGRAALQWLPGVYTSQGEFDEKLDSFSEQAARAKLKSLGEVRPTDADVKGMKESMFGIGRDEDVNIALLQEFIAEQKAAEAEYQALVEAKKSGNFAGYTPSTEVVEPDRVDEPEDPGEIRILNGVEYFKRNGKWYMR